MGASGDGPGCRRAQLRAGCPGRSGPGRGRHHGRAAARVHHPDGRRTGRPGHRPRGPGPLRGRLRDMGSNAVAFSGATTANGRGLLLGNPHYRS
ncbi:penicillin acylase family protein [Streptomyces sp. NPDC003015]